MRKNGKPTRLTRLRQVPRFCGQAVPLHARSRQGAAASQGVRRLPVTLLIRADELCIGEHVALHRSLDLQFRRIS